ncbi:hypothetical protein QBC35DRAFT_535941 [Podospora australis]|uniref:Uncharacterized protein n=1 Tax=Podospora australis TaxID=1536484 RepID=A0AAN6WN25_9PEZI|nr:hypothetical protein QBC35DRAFT_535941 [Podospora australis]
MCTYILCKYVCKDCTAVIDNDRIRSKPCDNFSKNKSCNVKKRGEMVKVLSGETNSCVECFRCDEEMIQNFIREEAEMYAFYEHEGQLSEIATIDHGHEWQNWEPVAFSVKIMTASKKGRKGKKGSASWDENPSDSDAAATGVAVPSAQAFNAEIIESI